MKDDHKKPLEQLYTDMKKVFTPCGSLSTVGEKNKWRIVEYKAMTFSGSLLTALDGACPEDITFNPGLSGWYKVYLLVLATKGCTVYIKMRSDKSYDCVAPSYQTMSAMSIEEFYWRCGEMNNEEIRLTVSKATEGQYPFLAGIRFVPMTEEEISAYISDSKESETKNVYASNDVHNLLFLTNIETKDDILSIVEPLKGSDTEWFSFEDIRRICSGKCPVACDDFAYLRSGDKHVEQQYAKFDYAKIIKNLCDASREIGIKSCVSYRMGMWGLNFPFNKSYFDCEFAYDHPQYRCITRDGAPVTNMSYAYPEVRKYMIGLIVEGARSGSDAVCLIAHRAPAYVLYEKPVVDIFFNRYGILPYTLPLDDPRLNQVHCEIMTGFFKELRDALDAALGKSRTQIHLRGQFSLYDHRAIGLDCEELARQGLVDAFITYPHRQYEVLDHSVWKDEERKEIDLKKYTESVYKETSTVKNICDFNFLEPYEDRFCNLVGPESQKERVEEWVAFSQKYSVPVYFDIMPRVMSNEEWKRRVGELYSMGASHIAMWDVSERIRIRPFWNCIRTTGHQEKADTVSMYEEGYRIYHLMENDGIPVGRYCPLWGG
jgi:hypothetical protein